MRNVMAAIVLAVGAGGAVAIALAADPNRDAGRAAGIDVLHKYGSSQAMSDQMMKPLSTDQQMKTVDGSQGFGAKVSCPGSTKFMRLTIFPNSSSDIDRFAVDLDANFDGAWESSNVYTGPYAAVCTNGLVQCAANTTTPCSYWRWKATGSGVTLDPKNEGGSSNSQADLGACYCVNASCGANLLMQNSTKVMNDMGTGIARALQATYPRLTMARAEQPDPVTQEFYGAQSGCSSDNQPEQYFKNSGAMASAGQAIASDQNSTYSKLMNSSTAQQHQTQDQSCTVSRQFTTAEYWKTDAIGAVSFSHDGYTESCGTGCIRLVVGKPGNNYLSASCGIHTDIAYVTVNNPELVTGATLTTVGYDDWLRVRFNDVIAWNADSLWTYEGARCGENGNRGTKYPGVSVLSYFTSQPAGSQLAVRIDTAWDDKGEGYAVLEIQTKQDCKITSESENNLCTAQQNNTDCRLKTETVDGVQTQANYYGTGLYPLPSTRSVSAGGCAVKVTRDWFDKSRVYTCPSSSPPYDGSDAKKRYKSIHSSLDTTTGAFTDSTKDKNGNWSTSSNTLSLVQPDSVQGCRMMCKTRKPAAGAAMGVNGATTTKNATGVAWDYTYRECGEDGACPSEAGETVVSACNCASNFTEAASMMQSIRMVGQDQVCTQHD